MSVSVDSRRRVVAIVSGGLDSVVMAHHLAAGCDLAALVSFDYGQRHARELRCAEACARRLGVRHEIVDLSSLRRLLAGSALTDDSVPVPHGHYEAESMKATIVPNRNMIMISIACGFAGSIGAGSVAFGAHAGDHAIYPDCRRDFVDVANDALIRATDGLVSLEAPFLGRIKADIVAQGARLGVPFSDTWSCYEGGDVHCGRCGTCVERREAFSDAGIPDPTKYMV